MKSVCVVKNASIVSTESRRISPYDYPKRLVRIVDDPRYKRQFDYYKKNYELTPKGLTIDILASKRNLEDLIKCVWLKMKI